MEEIDREADKLKGGSGGPSPRKGVFDDDDGRGVGGDNQVGVLKKKYKSSLWKLCEFSYIFQVGYYSPSFGPGPKQRASFSTTTVGPGGEGLLDFRPGQVGGSPDASRRKNRQATQWN